MVSVIFEDCPTDTGDFIGFLRIIWGPKINEIYRYDERELVSTQELLYISRDMA